MVRLALWRAAFRLGHALSPARTVQYACNLFRTPRRRPGPTYTVRADASRETIHVEGIPIAVYRWSDAPRQPYVLFAHGWSGSGLDLAPWIAPLRALHYSVIAFDQPGHGRSGDVRADLPRFVRTLAAVGDRFGPAAAVIGHSLGCAAVAVAMSSRMLAAERAVLVAPSADLAAATRRFTALMRMPPAMVDAMFAIFERDGIDFDALRADAVVPAIDRPALVVHDVDDREIPWEEGTRIANLWPGARLLSTRGLGHVRILADATVVDAGVRFLRGDAVGVPVLSPASQQTPSPA